MANANTPFGLRPIRSPGGDDALIGTEYAVAAAYVTNIYEGQPVMLAADGSVVIWAAGSKMLGIAAHYVAGVNQADDKVILVYDDPNTVFSAQTDDNTILDLGDLKNLAFEITNPAAGNTSTGQSTAAFASSVVAAAVATPTKILVGVSLSRAIDSDASLANNVVEVRIARTQHLNGANI